MKTFILMTRLAPQDADIIEVASKLQNYERQGGAWQEKIKEKCPEVNVLAHYALLGPYDFMDIYEAPDEESVAKVSMLSRANGAYQVESWLAIPAKKVAELAKDL